MLHTAPVSNRNMPFLNIHSTALTLLPTEQFESNIFYVLISRNNFNSNCLLFKQSRHNIHGILSQSPFVQIELSWGNTTTIQSGTMYNLSIISVYHHLRIQLVEKRIQIKPVCQRTL